MGVVKMLRRTVLLILDLLGVLAIAFAALSGLGGYVFGGSRAAFDDPTVIWFAPLFLTPLALIGVAMVLASSLISENRRGLLGWSVLVMAVLLAATAAAFNLTGLSTGEIELNGTLWGTIAIVVSLLYALSMLVVSGVGALVAKDIITTERTGHRLQAG